MTDVTAKVPPVARTMRAVEEAVFERVGVGDDTFVATEWASGPWDPAATHGGAPAALLARAIECHDAGSADALFRLTVDLLRPVPVGEPLTVSVETLRPGKKVALVGARLSVEQNDVVRAVGLRMREATIAVPDAGTGRGEALAVGPLAATPVDIDPQQTERPWFGRAMELRSVRGRFEDDGPATIWFRIRVPILAGETASPFMRVAAAADFGNGISRFLEWGRYRFINPDLTVAVHRQPQGEWVALDARSWAQPDGSGQSEAAVYDERGRIGRSVQTLLVDELS